MNNIIYIQKTIQWVKKSKQPLIFFRLDFSKAYDKVEWQFLFGCLKKLGIPMEFIAMTKLLFNGVKAKVNVNGYLSRMILMLREG